MYQKEIIYLNLYEDGIRGTCVGYLKIERKQDDYRMELQVKHMPRAAAGDFPVRMQGEADWVETAALEVKEGNGRWEGSSRERVRRAEIIISEKLKIKGQSRDAAAKRATPSAGETQQEPPRQSQEPQRSEKVLSPQPKQSGIAQEIPPEQPSIKAASKPPLYENKWEQLLTTYEQIHPYGDNRVYVKLEPKDFIILRSKYQHLVNNSFLLHGFYNYRYLILGKEDDFYLGVPGVFYEREKMVALMFGFEAFECEGGQAEEGKFGYYLRKVEL